MDIMHTILELENKVRGLSDSEAEMLRNFDEETKKEISRMKAETDEQIRASVGKDKEKRERKQNEAWQALEAKYRKETTRLEETYRNNKDKWVAEITARVLKH